VLDRLSADAKRAIVAAQGAARDAGAERIGVVHLVYGLVAAAGGDQSERLRSAGLDAPALRAHIVGEPAPIPPPLSAAEESDLRSELRRRGVPAPDARDLIGLVQRRRTIGPVELDDHCRRIVTDAVGADDEISVARLLRAVLASPAPDLAMTLAALGVEPAALRAAVAD
jgi:ATP-dependent Clp protease ATP-binding subunit ClpA